MSKLKLKAQFFKRTKIERFYNLDCAIIGLTGSIGTGKSSASKFLRQLGHPVIDADKLVKKIYEKNESISFIKSLNEKFITQNKTIDFKVLRESFFTDAKLQKTVEDYIYSLLEAEFRLELTGLNVTNYVFYDIPLLFEKQIESLFDLTLCVYCSQEQQLQRVMKRDSISEDLALKIITKQIPIEEKSKKCDIVISNTGKPHELKKIIEKFTIESFVTN